MSLSCETFLPLSCFAARPDPRLTQARIEHFLSFQDAFHYLIKALELRGQTVLLPEFYCDATVNDMRGWGLNVAFYRIDHGTFDADPEDFKAKLRGLKPGVVIIYHIFGKTSALRDDRRWLEDMGTETVLIEDLAHSLLVNHLPVRPLVKNHYYIDSPRKTVSCMMSNLVLPDTHKFQPDLTATRSVFAWRVRGLFLAKTFFLRLGQCFDSRALMRLGMDFFVRHDSLIGSPKQAYRALWWDRFLYPRIHFDKIMRARPALYKMYQHHFKALAARGVIEMFPVRDEEAERLSFFPVRICDETRIPDFIRACEAAGYYPERLWDFDKLEGLAPERKPWLKSIVVFPLTIHALEADIQAMAKIMDGFFK